MSHAAPSGKLVRLDAEIAAERDPIKRGCLRAERAGLLARQGFSELAREGLDKLHRDFDRNPDAGVSIWMQIAEGWMAHYNDRPDAASDHFKRAYALSSASSKTDLKALSAAWLAHLAFSQNRFPEMAAKLQIAIDSASPNFHPAQARLSMILAMAYHFSRRLDLAIPWYKKCREHAFADGDDGTISSLSFNMAGLQGNHAIQAAVFGGHVNEYAGLALAGASSSQSFDQITKVHSRNKWVFILQAYTLSAGENYAEANVLYQEHLDDACRQGLEHQRAFFVADRAWCRSQLGDLTGARQDAFEAANYISEEMYVEDRAVACGRLSQALKALGNDESSAKYKALSLIDWSKHETARIELLELLASLNLFGLTKPSF